MSSANNIIQFPKVVPNEFHMDADYFGSSETIPITELLNKLQELEKYINEQRRSESE